MMHSKLKVSSKNEQTISKYLNDLTLVEHMRPTTIQNTKQLIRTLGDFLGNKQFKDATKDDMKEFLTKTTYQGDSQEPLKATIRKFYKWLYESETYPDCVKWMKLKTMKQRLAERDIDNNKKKMVSDEEYQRMIKHVSHDMQMQAVLETFNYTGARVGELVSMNIKDVEICDGFAILSIRESKTKKRQVPIKTIPELIVRWIDNHPMKSNPDAPLFISTNRDPRVFMKRLSKFYVERVFRNITRDLKMKRITPHSFRHTCISRDLYNGMPTTHVTTKFGWAKDSVMLRVYDHNDTDELVKWVTGKAPRQAPTIDILQQKKDRFEKEISTQERMELLERTVQLLNTRLNEKSGFSQGFIQNGSAPSEVPEKYQRFMNGVSQILMKALNSGVPEETISNYMKSISQHIQ